MIQKWPKYGQKLFFRHEKGFKKVVCGPEFFVQIGQKWLKNGQKMFSRPKKGPNIVEFGPEKKIVQIGQKMAKNVF